VWAGLWHRRRCVIPSSSSPRIVWGEMADGPHTELLYTSPSDTRQVPDRVGELRGDGVRADDERQQVTYIEIYEIRSYGPTEIDRLGRSVSGMLLLGCQLTDRVGELRGDGVRADDE
jgi:hypothetical protein